MKCGICSAEAPNTFLEVPEMMFGTRELFRYFTCPSCGCLQIERFPEDMSAYYPAGYYSFSSDDSLNSFKGRVKSLIKLFRGRYAVFNESGLIGSLLYFLKPDPGLRALFGVVADRDAKILDVGCGSGFQLHVLKDMGFKDILGIDPFIANDTEYANGLKVLKKTIFEVENKWDVIILNHSLEHMPGQAGVFKKIQELLLPGGVCIIRIPVADSWAFAHYGKHWVQLDAPRHFYLHTKKSIETLCSGAGLQVSKIIYDSFELQFTGSEKYIKGKALAAAESCTGRVFGLFKNFYYRRKAAALNKAGTGDQAVFYIKQKGGS